MERVFCVIPVHNRLSCLRSCMDYLNAQDYKPIHIVVVDDGSTDGTGEYLATRSQQNLTVLKGDGNLWWGGAMRMGMEYVTAAAEVDDYLLMLNDDVEIDDGYVSALVRESRQRPGAVIGSVQRDRTSGAVLGTGFSVDYPSMKIELLDDGNAEGEVDGLPGRGVLYLVSIIQRIGQINSRFFPHYLGDVEYSARAKDKGYLLAVSRDANVYTDGMSSDQQVQQKGLLARWTHPRSKSNLFRRMLFFSLRGPIWLRVCMLPRMAGLVFYKLVLRKTKGNVRTRGETE